MQKHLSGLRGIRKAKGMTLAELSQKSGVSLGSIGNYETRTRGISRESLAKIAHVLNVQVAEILQTNGQETTASPTTPPVGSDNRPPSTCHYPTDCDLPARISAMESQLTETRTTISRIEGQLETLCSLLSGPLRAGIDAKTSKRAG